MSCLQNFPDTTEATLVRDEASALSESGAMLENPVDKNSEPSDVMEAVQDLRLPDTGLPDIDPSITGETKEATDGSDFSGLTDDASTLSEKSEPLDVDGAASLPPEDDFLDPTPSCSGQQIATIQADIFQPECDYLDDSLLSMDELPYKLQDKILKLEKDNYALNQQLIDVKFVLTEVQSENAHLQHELDVANETFEATQVELEQYRVRAQRILEERETLIALRDVSSGSDAAMDERAVNSCNEELRKELEFQEERCNDLMERLVRATGDLSYLQRNFLSFQKDDQEEKQRLHEFYRHEANMRAAVEQEFRDKCKELDLVVEQLAIQTRENADRNSEVACLREQLRKRQGFPFVMEADMPLPVIAKTVMGKQNTVQALTNERNVLLLQLEKYEKQHHRLLTHLSRLSAEHCNKNENDENKDKDVPTREARKVKRAHSTLEALSIRIGVFLKKYPLARVFIFSYMVLLHMWVLFVLWAYLPSSSN